MVKDFKTRTVFGKVFREYPNGTIGITHHGISIYLDTDGKMHVYWAKKVSENDLPSMTLEFDCTSTDRVTKALTSKS